jgi:DNA-directed RNA polymerase subunit RPC12/RpoP
MICPHCHAEVEGKWVDEGIGAYEYWGSKEVDVQMEFVCEECDGPLESEQSYSEYVADMKEDFAADRYFDRDY